MLGNIKYRKYRTLGNIEYREYIMSGSMGYIKYLMARNMQYRKYTILGNIRLRVEKTHYALMAYKYNFGKHITGMPWSFETTL